jgi:shikimate kinase
MAFFIIQATTMQPEQPNPEIVSEAVPKIVPRAVQRVVLIGFMGAGKSTLGPILAERLEWRFVDADRELESKTGTAIADLFTDLGEPAFRRMEAENVARLLARRETVIALGGGAIEAPATRSLLATLPYTCVVFLRAPLEVLVERCEQQPDAAERPVLRQREALRQRFLARLPHYESAHLAVDTVGLNPQAVADQLLQQMVELSYAISLDQKATTT